MTEVPRPAARQRVTRTPRRRRRAAQRLAALLLAAVVMTFYFTAEPAPRVLIRWGDAAVPEQRVSLLRRFGLVRPHEPDGTAVMYDLLDTRSANIQELLEQPEVAGSGYFDERGAAVSVEALAGERRTWLLQRLVISPELRVYRVVPAVVAACLATLAWGLVVAARVNVARARRLRAAVRRRSRQRDSAIARNEAGPAA